MKKIDKYLIIILLLSLLPFWSLIINPLLPHTQDGLVHLARMAAHYKALVDGQFPPRWAADLNYGYGMPIFIFMYPLPYLLSSFFIFLTGSLVISFKLLVILSFLLSGIFMYLFSKELFKSEKIAIWATLFYQFAPFRLVEANIRGDIGEIYTYTFLPLVLWGILRGKFIVTSMATALLILSHNSISLVFFAICCGFSIFFSQNKKQLFYGLAGLAVGLALSAFYWLPALYEHRFTYGNLFMQNVYKEYFTVLYKLFLPNLANWSSLNMGDVPVQIGIFHVSVLILTLIFLFKQKEKKLSLFLISIFLIALFFTQSVSALFWERITLLRQFQFPWRFVSVMVFTTALCSGVVITRLKSFQKNGVMLVILFLMIISTITYWQTPFGYDRINDSDYWNYPKTTTYYGEIDTIWTDHPASDYPQSPVQVIGGKGEITNFSEKPLIHEFKVSAKSDVHLIDQTQYFPGWRVFANAKELPIQFQDANHRGIITFNLEKGESDVKVIFGKTKDRIISEIISLLSLLLVLALAIFKKLRYNLLIWKPRLCRSET